ncbi:hypothetical protein PPSIR1_32113 [Plesiocystis pacifica SIR-1]|uniref:Uncharacterized protein n=1 Tax=Plesiocystis pacifica SIR-1 TaxID=391625 RepID=A6G2Z0_9BACT|nr:TerB family tellurite resistance protein [Plesiocystis pacifica]EDM79840.1 hypothetical protein PPSIR1_32113 [Plesiocystis pacifica SIR-1]
MADNNDSGLAPQEVEAFARGLWYLAGIDGEVHDREKQLIEEFLNDAGSGLTISTIASEGFQPIEAAAMLETTFLKHVFMKAAIALVYADGVYTDNERRAIGEFADAFGMNNAEFGDLEQVAKVMQL